MNLNKYFNIYCIFYFFIFYNLAYGFDWKVDQCETEPGFQINTDPPNQVIGHTTLAESREQDQKTTGTCFAHTIAQLLEMHLKQDQPTQTFKLAIASILAGNGSKDTTTGGAIASALYRLKKSNYLVRNEFEHELDIEELGKAIGRTCKHPMKDIEIIPKTIRDVEKVLALFTKKEEISKSKINNIYNFNIHTIIPKKYDVESINEYIIKNIPVGIGLAGHAVTLTGAATVCCKDICEKKFLVRNSQAHGTSGWMSASKLLTALSTAGVEITYLKKCDSLPPPPASQHPELDLPKQPLQVPIETCTPQPISDSLLKTLAMAHDRKQFHALLQQSRGSLAQDPSSGIEALEAAIVTDKHFAVQGLLRVEMDLNAHGLSGFTPLQIALFHKNKVALEALLAHPRIDVNARNKDKESPLEMALLRHNMEALQVLLAHPRIDVNAKNSEGSTPLEIALKDGNHKAFQALLTHPGIDVNAKNSEGLTLLEIAQTAGNEEALYALLAHPGIDVNARNSTKNSQTLLEIAIIKNDTKLLRKLLSQPKIDVNSINPSNKLTALQQAIGAKKPYAIKELLQTKAVNVNTRMASNGLTALNMAAKMGDINTLQQLLAHPNIRLTDKMLKDQTLLEFVLNLEAQTPHKTEIIDLLFKNEAIRRTITGIEAAKYRKQLLESATKTESTFAVEQLLSLDAHPSEQPLPRKSLIEVTGDPDTNRLLETVPHPQPSQTGHSL